MNESVDTFLYEHTLHSKLLFVGVNSLWSAEPYKTVCSTGQRFSSLWLYPQYLNTVSTARLVLNKYLRDKEIFKKTTLHIMKDNTKRKLV